MDWIPILSQIKSAVQAITGDLEGARATQESFSTQCPLVAQARSLAEVAFVSEDAARSTQERFLENAVDVGVGVVTGTPGLGHAVGAVQYAAGYTEAGDRSMKSASRTTGVMVGGVLGFVAGGPAGAIAGGMGGGAVMDGITTGVDSAVHGEYRPAGTVASVTKVVKVIESGGHPAGAVFDATVSVAMDGLVGFGTGKTVDRAVNKMAHKQALSDLQKATDKVGYETLPTTKQFRKHHLNANPALRLEENPRLSANTVLPAPEDARHMRNLEVYMDREMGLMTTPRNQLLEVPGSNVRLRHAVRGADGAVIDQTLHGRPLLVVQNGNLIHWHGAVDANGVPLPETMEMQPFLFPNMTCHLWETK